MSIDFSQLDQALATEPSINDDVAYLRQHAKQFIQAVDAQEGLHTEVVLPLPLGTWNAAFVLQPANLVLKLSPWSDQFEADFLKLATTMAVPVPKCFAYGTVPDLRLPNASYVLMQHIANSYPAGPLLDQGRLLEAELIAIGQALGTALANLHRVTFPHLRHFDNTTLDWGTCLALWDLVETALFDGPLLARFTQILEQTHYRQQRQGTLTHSDANLHNILVDANTHTFQALIDPGPMIIGLPMYDLAYAVQPWKYGHTYHQAVVTAYQTAGGQMDRSLFYTSLLCVAYQQSRYYDPTLARIRTFIQSDILPHIT
jgi:aminoglycoside phosphotransferase (APT) family kinase protein